MDTTIFVYYFLSLSTISQKYLVMSDRLAVIKTIPEDEEYAEYYFLHPEEKADAPKSCLRKDLRYKTDVCNIDPALFLEMCREVAEVESIRSLYQMFTLDYDRKPEPCQNCSVKFYRSKIKEGEVHYVQARPCPAIEQPLWVSKGHEVGGIFVYNENFVTDEKLRIEDYIIFLETTDDDY